VRLHPVNVVLGKTLIAVIGIVMSEREVAFGTTAELIAYRLSQITARFDEELTPKAMMTVGYFSDASV